MGKTKFLKASSFYPQYLSFLYNTRPELGKKNYTLQLEEIMSDCFGWSNFWKKNLELTGKFEALEIITNAGTLQKQWAKERNLKYNPEKWQQEILEAQIMEFEPEIFFAHDYEIINPSFRKRIRKNCPSVKIILGWDGLQYNNPEKYEGSDIILSCISDCAEFYNKTTGYKGYYFKFGFESSILDHIISRPPVHELSFVGSISFYQNAHHKRFRDITNLARKTPIELWINMLDTKKNYFSREQLSRLKQLRFKEYRDVLRLQGKNHGGLFGLAMYQTLADSRLTFNSHIDAAGKNAANIRMVEATGAGTCLITDWKENIRDFFEPGKEVVTYKTIDECIEKVNYLLRHESERKKIALEGQKKTCSTHSFQKRVNEFVSFLTF